MFNNTYPLDHIIQTEWWSERVTDPELHWTRDHYIVLRHRPNDHMKYVVHTGYTDSPEYGYCSGDYYLTFMDALEGFVKRAKRKGFTRAFSPHLADLQRDLDATRGELFYHENITNIEE